MRIEKKRAKWLYHSPSTVQFKSGDLSKHTFPALRLDLGDIVVNVPCNVDLLMHHLRRENRPFSAYTCFSTLLGFIAASVTYSDSDSFSRTVELSQGPRANNRQPNFTTCLYVPASQLRYGKRFTVKSTSNLVHQISSQAKYN